MYLGMTIVLLIVDVTQPQKTDDNSVGEKVLQPTTADDGYTGYRATAACRGPSDEHTLYCDTVDEDESADTSSCVSIPALTLPHTDSIYVTCAPPARLLSNHSFPLVKCWKGKWTQDIRCYKDGEDGPVLLPTTADDVYTGHSFTPACKGPSNNYTKYCYTETVNTTQCVQYPGFIAPSGTSGFVFCAPPSRLFSGDHLLAVLCLDGKWSQDVRCYKDSEDGPVLLPTTADDVYTGHSSTPACKGPSDNRTLFCLHGHADDTPDTSQCAPHPGFSVPHHSGVYVGCAPPARLLSGASFPKVQCLDGKFSQDIRCYKDSEDGPVLLPTTADDVYTGHRVPLSCKGPSDNHTLYCAVENGRPDTSKCVPDAGEISFHNSLIFVTCAPPTRLLSGESHTSVFCDDGKWSQDITCYHFCPPLVSTTLNLECWQGTELANCSDHQPVKTRVKFSCKQYTTLSLTSNLQYIRCLDNGTWSRDLPRCEADCGDSDLIRSTPIPTILNGTKAKTSNFPWNAAIFLKQNGVWSDTVLCGGSLITTRAVLTAAHCVTEKNDIRRSEALNPEDVAVAVGKLYRQWAFSQDIEVNTTVQTIFVHHSYRGPSTNYDADIAILMLTADVEVNRYVMPVCLDPDKNSVRDLASIDNPGYVMGWGKIVDCPSQGFSCNNYPKTLMYSRTTVLAYHICTDIMQKGKPSNERPSVTSDKMCSSDISESVIQSGDSGGGLVYRIRDQFVLYGVVSNRIDSFGLFTNVTEYMDWIIEKISNFT